MKQTATDCLYDRVLKLFMQYHDEDVPTIDFSQAITEAYEWAKEMEKQQITDAYNDGSAEWTDIEYTDAEQYYNETYNQ